MTDTYVPSTPLFAGAGGGVRDAGGSDALLDYYDDVANRTKLLTDTSPWLAKQPDVLQAMASNPGLGYEDLAYRSAELAGMVNLDGLARQLGEMTPAAQRAISAQLTDTQRRALEELGYRAPSRDEGGLFGGALEPLGQVVGAGVRSLNTVFGPAAGMTLDALTFIGDQPAHVYRTIRSLDTSAQLAGLGGALAGAIGIFAAPFTGGLSLGLTASVIGFGALGGASIASAVAANPSDWWDTFNNTWDGERVFTRQAQEQARQILGVENESLLTLARDVAWEGSLVDLATEFASTRDATAQNQMLRSVHRVAERLADPTDPNFGTIVEGLTKLATDEQFTEAVKVLQDGKISFGRDLARAAGLQPGDTGYGFVSGAADGLWLVALDPTLYLGKASKLWKAYRYAVPITEDGTAVGRRVAELVEQRVGVRRAFDVMADAVETGYYRRAKNALPGQQSLFLDLRMWRAQEKAAGRLDVFDRDELVRYFQSSGSAVNLMRGRGARVGEKRIFLPSLGAGSWQWAKAKGWAKAVIDFADERNGMRTVGDKISELGDDLAAAQTRRRRYRMESLTDAEHNQLDTFLELVDDYAGYSNDFAYTMTVTRAQREVVEILRRTGVADDEALQLMDAFGRARLVPDTRSADHIFETATKVRETIIDDIPPLDPTSVSRPDLMPTARGVTGNFGMVVPDAAVAGTDYVRTRAFMHAIGKAPFLGYLESQIGAFLGSFTSQIPRGAVNLNDALSIDKFVDLGRVMGMPADVRDAWRAMILAQESIAQRITAVDAYLDTMLKAAGVETLPEGIDISNRFLVKYHQAFALNGLDELWVSGRPRRVGLMPVNDQALALAIPDLRELRHAVQRGTVLKWILNATDHHFIDQAMSRVWKPAVLLRLGFIPRAAGEELLAHWARNGVTGMLADWGEVSIYRGEVSADPQAALRHYRVTELDEAMLDEMRRWRTASHLRPIERLASRIGPAGRPAVYVMEKYTEWLRGILQRGVAPQLADNLPPRFRRAVIGNEASFRRLMLTGSDPQTQRGIAAMESRWADSLAREISARNASLYEPMNQDKIVTHLTRQTNGELVDQQYVRMADAYRFYGIDDPLYANAMHEQVNHVLTDPVIARAYMDTVGRAIPDEILVGELGPVLELLSRYGDTFKDGTLLETQLLSELLDKELLDYDDLAQLSRILTRAGKTDVTANLPMTGVTPAEVLDALGGLGLDFDRLVGMRRIVNELDYLTPPARSWLALQLEHGTFTADEATTALASFNARGLPDMQLGFENPDEDMGLAQWLAGSARRTGPGSLEDLADAPAIFYSLEQAQVMFRDRLVGLLRDGRFSEGVDQSLRASLLAGLPVMNPPAAGTKRLYFPALDADHMRSLIAQVEEARMFSDELATAGVEQEIIDTLMLNFENALSAQRVGGRVVDVDAAAVRQTFLELIDSADIHEELIRDAALNGFERTVPLTYGGVTSSHAAQAMSDALAMMADANHIPGHGRLSFLDAPVDWTPPWRQIPDADPRVVLSDSLQALGRIELVPGELVNYGKVQGSLEEAVERWADDAAERVRQVSQPSMTSMLPRGEMYRKVNGGLQPVNVPEGRADELPRHFALDRRGQYVDAEGNAIAWGDPRFMRPVADTGQANRVAWSMVGPVMRDAMDSIRGTVSIAEGGRRRMRSTVRQISELPAWELPDHAVAASLADHKQGAWSKVVDGFFDRIVGPSLDGIVRTPMARHLFLEAYRDNERAFRWLIDTELIDDVIPAAFGDLSHGISRDELLRLGRALEPRMVLGTHVDDDELVDIMRNLDDRVLRRIRDDAYNAGDRTAAAAADRYEDWRRLPNLQSVGAEDPNLELIYRILDDVGDSIKVPWGAASQHRRLNDILDATPLYHDRIAENWTALQQAHRSIQHAHQTIGEASSTRAIANAIPFLDSHEIKSQFGDYARNLLPFWYAEENFLKRWAKTLRLAPEAIRKGQLTYMGMREVGLVRTDANGRDWFVYPGSTQLADVLSLLPGVEALPVGAMLQAETRNMLPGFNRVGVPSASPLVTVPLEGAQQMFPELRPLQRAIVGDEGLNRGILRQFVPGQVMNVYEAMLQDEGNSRRYASAMIAAAAHMEAYGNGLEPDATVDERDAYMRTLRRHARAIVMTQALVGFVAPGAPSQLAAGETASFSGIGATDVGALLSEEYRRMVQTFGLDEGTAMFLNEHDGDLGKMVAPLAFTEGKTRSSSGAVIPMTMEAVDFYNDNADWIGEFPHAGAWLLPPDQDARGAGEQYAFTQQLIDGLRERKTPAEFVTALKFKEGATLYFEQRKQYTAARAGAKTAGNDELVRLADARWEEWSRTFLAQHPIFATELQSTDGKQRRNATLDEMRVALQDPEGPEPWHRDDMRLMMGIFDEYKLRLRQFANDRTVATRRVIDQYKVLFEDTMEAIVLDKPHLEAFWTSVLRPESQLS